MLKIKNTLFKRALTCVVIYAITAIIFACSLAHSSDLKTRATKILKKYNSSAAVEMTTVKTEEKKALGISTSNEGQLIYSKSKIFFTTEKPSKTEIIYNKSVWIVEYPDLELDSTAGRKVTEFEAKKVIFLKTMAELFSAPEKFLTKESKLSETDSEIIVQFSKIKDSTLKDLKVVLNKKDKIIASIKLTDDLDTETKFEFTKTVLLPKAPAAKFIYKKLKTDEVLKP
jgi:outer membrane lipoprotein-sorting protein